MDATLLIEIGTEELPAKTLKALGLAFRDALGEQLSQAGFSHGLSRWYATPRRLAVQIWGVALTAPSQQVERRGPSYANAYCPETGQPTTAARGWAKNCQIALENAEIRQTPKGAWLYHTQMLPGSRLGAQLETLLKKTIASLPLPCAMHWGAAPEQIFVRPVQTVAVLLDSSLIPLELFGIQSSRQVRGHRFMGASTLSLRSAEDYETQLRVEGSVIADYTHRRAQLAAQLDAAAQACQAHLQDEEALLDEVTGLVEWPVVLQGTFDAQSLALPPEPIVQTLQGDQRIFPLFDAKARLLPKFLLVSNLAVEDPAPIIASYETVVRARLADADFFFKEDSKAPLTQWLPMLSELQVHPKLGSMQAKTERLVQLASYIGKQIGADLTATQRGALLCKCDLLSRMVFEFPEIQGVMGGHYARRSGESDSVADAISTHYYPRFSKDTLPQTLAASALAIADKLDQLIGCFAIGEIPKGAKDPFALRRAALGLLRITIEQEHRLDLLPLVQMSEALYGEAMTAGSVISGVIDFILQRLKAWYQALGFSLPMIEGVLHQRVTAPLLFHRRLMALKAFLGTPAAQETLQAHKRLSQFLKQPLTEQMTLLPLTTLALQAQPPSARKLVDTLGQFQAQYLRYLETGEELKFLEQLPHLSACVMALFDNVFVMGGAQAEQRANFACLLHSKNYFDRIADFSYLNG